MTRVPISCLLTVPVVLVGVIVKSSYNLPEPSLEALLCTLRHSGNLEQRLVQLRMELAGSVPVLPALDVTPPHQKII